MKTKIVSGIAIVMLSFFISCDSSNDGNDNNPTLTAKDIAVNSKIDVAMLFILLKTNTLHNKVYLIGQAPLVKVFCQRAQPLQQY